MNTPAHPCDPSNGQPAEQAVAPASPANSPSQAAENKNQPKRPKVKIATKSPYAAQYMPMLEALAARDELNEVIKSRVVKCCEMLDAGVPLYPNDFERTDLVGSVVTAHENLSAEEIETAGTVVQCAGRVVSLRSFGKVTFFHIMDQSGRIQCYAAKEHLNESYTLFKKFDVGDIVGVRGTLFHTKTGELTISCTEVKLVSKSIRPLPEKYHGLKDVETRYRQRYVDLIVTPRSREIFQKRTQILREFRWFFENEGFFEVETPMLHPIPGGAAAKPFITHHNALDMDLYLRIAPELYLKRLLVGGFEKVFEINRSFRNEGLSIRHNPEFTMCEFYWAYATYKDLMDLTERLYAHLAQTVCGSLQLRYGEYDVDLTPGKWQRLSFHSSLEVVGGHSPDFYNDPERIIKYARERGEKAVEGEKLGKLQAKLFDLDVEPKLIQPTFIYRYPTDISPLSRRSNDNPEVTDRFELFITGREMANAFSELNDPLDQRMRFLEQVAEKDAGDDEAHYMDEDYLRALEYAMPPAAGQGIGIDRLVMLLTNSASIREVLLFPQLKLESYGMPEKTPPAGHKLQSPGI